MFQLESTEILQLIAWGIALVEVVLGFYIIALNIWDQANRHLGILLLAIAANSYAIGQLLTTTTVDQASLPTQILAATTPGIQTGLLLIAIMLLKPELFKRRGIILRLGLYLSVLLPVALTIIDSIFDSGLWYTPLSAENFVPGFIPLQEYSHGALGPILRPTLIYFMVFVTLIPILWVAFFDKTVSPFKKRLALLLLGTQLAGILINFVTITQIPSQFSLLLTSTIFATGYGYAGFSQLISERHLQKGLLQIRLTALILVITLPILLAVSGFGIHRSGITIQQNSLQRLDDLNQSISSTISTWLALNIRALESINTLTSIKSMDGASQKEVLYTMAQAYPHMYLISTIGLDGVNIARSDNAALTDYSDRAYFQNVIAGDPIAFQTLIGKTSNQPALVIAKPILGENNEIVGVGMFASTLESVNRSIQIGIFDETGMAFLVDEKNQVIGHSNPEFISGELKNLNANPAIAALRQDDSNNIVRYKDENGILWIASVNTLENGWGVVVQQQENEILSDSKTFQTIIWFIVGFATLLISSLTSLAIRQAIRPIRSLTATATAIIEGDLSQVAPIESEDEISILAGSFNQMTAQYLELIGSLEQRISLRTKDLEQKTLQLQAATEVGRAASSLLDVNQLFDEVVYAIRDRFGLYYVGLFLINETKEWAYLRTGTGEAGKAMLARQHRIKIGEGMIGWAIENAQARIVQEVGEDAIRLATSELPETRSETAIPLRARGQVIGAFTIQDKQPDAFDEASIAIFQTMADLVSIAIDNARLFTESQEALELARKAYGSASQSAWSEALEEGRAILIQSDQSGTSVPENIVFDPEMQQVWSSGLSIQKEKEDRKTLLIPIKVRDSVVGVLNTHKPSEAGNWEPEEISMIETIIEQMGIALESARLYEDTQRRAEREQVTQQLSDRIHRAADIETLMNTIIQEVAATLGASSSFVQFGTLPEGDFSSELPDTASEETKA